MQDIQDRFWRKVYIPNFAPDCCWIWLAGNVGGYGEFRIQGKMKKAHRVAYELIIGEIPVGLKIDHLCRNQLCVNPIHLEAVSHRENVIRGKVSALNPNKKSKYPGVYWQKSANKWTIQLTNLFDNEEKAYQVYSHLLKELEKWK